jgi:hypothetical protein
MQVEPRPHPDPSTTHLKSKNIQKN